MTRQLYAIRDLKAKEYIGGLFQTKTKEEAQRFYLIQLRDGRVIHRAYRNDYALHYLGTFDTATGQIAHEPPSDETPYELRDALQAEENNVATA